MKKKLLLTFIILLVLILIIFFVLKLQPKSNPIQINTNNIDQNYTLKNGEFEIVKDTNGGVPYIWKLEVTNNKIKSVGKYSKELYPEKQLAGGPVEEHYIFKGVEPGETIITFKYVSVTDDSVNKIEKYKVTIDNNLNSTVSSVK